MSKPSTKAIILEALRDARGHEVSGERLAEICTVSRVAVWKNIHDCIESGYPITATKAGYAYEASGEDFLFPAEFGELERFVTYVQETSSTMDIAREKALAGAPDGSIVIAETQTAGRGRNRRTWISPKGSLLFTLILRPDEPLASYYAGIRASQYALAETIARRFPRVRVSAKWPNDLLIDGKKAGGILAEAMLSAETVAWLNIGIGLNVNNQSPSDSAQSLSELGAPTPSRSSILKSFLEIFRELASKPDTLQGLEKRYGLLGKHCTALLPDGRRLGGTLLRIDEFGGAWFSRGSDGTAIRLDASTSSVTYSMEDFS